MSRELGRRRYAVFYYWILGVFAAVLILFVSYNILPRRLQYNTSVIVFENEIVKVEQKASLPRLAVSYVDNGDVYSTEDHYLYKNERKTDYFSELGHLTKSNGGVIDRLKDAIARLRITRDLRQNYGADNYVVLKSGTIIAFYDSIYRSSDHGVHFNDVYDFEENGVYNPYYRGIAVDKNDDIYFGEYNCSKRPHAIRIIKGTNDGRQWSVFYTFTSGDIFHVHNIKYDPFRDLLWVMTGDTDEESRLMYLDRARSDVVTVGTGDQGWRIVSLVPTRDALYWCSDNDKTGSHIYRYDVASKSRQAIKYIGNPSYFSTAVKDGTLAISTTYEPESSFSKKNSASASTDLWISKEGDKWHKVYSIQGNIFKREKFGLSRPTMVLPSGDYSSKDLFVTPVSTGTALDFHTLVFEITWKN